MNAMWQTRGFFNFKVKKLRTALKVNTGKCFYEFTVLLVYEIFIILLP